MSSTKFLVAFLLGITLGIVSFTNAQGYSKQDFMKMSSELNTIFLEQERAYNKAALEGDVSLARKRRGAIVDHIFKRQCNGICYDKSNYCRSKQCSECPERSKVFGRWHCLCDSNARMPSFVNRTEKALCEKWDPPCCGTGKYCPSCENCPVGFYFADKYDMSDEDIEMERVYGSIEGTFGKCINNQACMRGTNQRCSPKISCPLGSAYDHASGKCICGGINKDNPEMAAYVNFNNWKKVRALWPINLNDACLQFPPPYFKNYWVNTNIPEKDWDYRVIPRMWTCNCPPGTMAFNGHGNGFRYCIKKSLAMNGTEIVIGDPHRNDRCIEYPSHKVDYYHYANWTDFKRH